MANTYTLIASTTLASSQANINFTSISSTYTDLSLVFSGRSDYVGNNNTMNILINGASTTFTVKTIFGDGSSAGSQSATTNQYIGWLPAATATANTFGNSSLYFPNYTSSNQKSFSGDTVTENNASGGVYLGLIAGLWSGTAAINAISINSRDGNFVQYSTAYLYGVKNA
jgi:hypothetical protein